MLKAASCMRRCHHCQPHLCPGNLHPEFGYGLDGLLLSRQYKLHGILNGIDTTIWNPSTDVHLPAHYSMSRILPGKRRNKQAVLERFLPRADDAAMPGAAAGTGGRLVEQKGIDWVLAAMPVLLAETDVRFVLLAAASGCTSRKSRAWPGSIRSGYSSRSVTTSRWRTRSKPVRICF